MWVLPFLTVCMGIIAELPRRHVSKLIPRTLQDMNFRVAQFVKVLNGNRGANNVAGARHHKAFPLCALIF
jgi:hypothetical protein